MSEPQRVAILTIGSELLAGDGLDTNSQWLSRRLVRLGFDVWLHASCPDDQGAIVSSLKHAADQVEVVIVTGGLGPTSDDLSREAIAEFLGVPLEVHEPTVEHIQALFARFGREMPDSNRSQAEMPQGARVLKNKVGTAGCFAAEHEGTLIYALPGVPREVYWMWDTYLRGELGEKTDAAPMAERTFRTVGISESALGENLRPLEEEGDVEVRYAAEEARGTIRVTLLTASEGRAQELWLRARDIVGPKHLAALGNDLLPEAIAGLLWAQGLTLATAESCTGGKVAASLVELAGISSVFLEGVVSYSNAAKTRLLGVPAELIEAKGAVSEEVAHAMARGARERAGADLGLGITGVAGPGGGSEEKPVGLVHIAVAGPGPDDMLHLERRYPGDRRLIQTRASAGALNLIRLAIESERAG